MKQKSSKRTVLAAALAVAGMFGLITSPAFADVHVSQNGATLTVTAPSTLAGKGLLLQTDAESAGTWTTATNIVGAVPSEGGVYTVDLAALGIANGTSCRIASATIYNRLDMLQMTNKNCYVDTGFLGTQVYGIRLGFYATGQSGDGTVTSDYYYVFGCGKNGNTDGPIRGGIALMESLWYKDDGTVNVEPGSKVRCIYRGADTTAYTPTVKTDAINEYGITNRVFTINGTKISNLTGKASLSWPTAEPVATNITYNIYLGRSGHNKDKTADNQVFAIFGWWSHVSFDDAEGNKILDYVPFQRGDGTAGFWDYATDKFVTSGGPAPFKAGTQTGESFTKDEEILLTFTANRQLAYSSADGAVTISIPAGLAGESIIIAWDSEDKGDDLAAWTHSATLTDSATEGDLTARLGRLGIRNGDYARVFAANVYKPLDMLQMTDINCYIDTGFLGTHVYGARAGFYATGQSGTAQYDFYYFMGCAKDGDGGGVIRGGFSVGEGAWFNSDGTVANEPGKCRYIYRGVKNGAPTNPNLNTDCINEYVFTNRVFSLNCNVNTAKLSGKESVTWPSVEPMATNMTYNVYLGRCGHNKDATNANSSYAIFGWWSHVSLEDADGNNLIDYIPVQRVSDNKVGFYDRASLSFVTSSGSGTFTAGNVTNDTPVVAANASSSAWKVTSIQGLIILFK